MSHYGPGASARSIPVTCDGKTGRKYWTHPQPLPPPAQLIEHRVSSSFDPPLKVLPQKHCEPYSTPPYAYPLLMHVARHPDMVVLLLSTSKDSRRGEAESRVHPWYVHPGYGDTVDADGEADEDDKEEDGEGVNL